MGNMPRFTRQFLGRCQTFTLTFASTMGVAYMFLLIYLFASGVTMSADYASRREEEMRTAALEKKEIPFAYQLDSPDLSSADSGNSLQSSASAAWCLLPERKMGPFLKSILCIS